jgi:hypothetical protein
MICGLLAFDVELLEGRLRLAGRAVHHGDPQADGEELAIHALRDVNQLRRTLEDLRPPATA